MNAHEIDRKIKKAGSIDCMYQAQPEEVFICSKHGEYSGNPIIIFNTRHEPECPHCVIEKEKEIEKAELSTKINHEIERLEQMNVGRRFWGESFDTFKPYSSELKHILETVKSFAHSPAGRKLVMLGEHGNGKTHLAVATLKITGGVIHTAFEIGVLLRQSFGGDTQEWKVLRDLSEAPMLVIDEVEKIKGSTWDHNWFSYVVNRRHENMLPTVFISNCHLKDDCSHGGCSMCIESNLESDVLSRITEDGIVLKFNSPDYRAEKRKAGGPVG